MLYIFPYPLTTDSAEETFFGSIHCLYTCLNIRRHFNPHRLDCIFDLKLVLSGTSRSKLLKQKKYSSFTRKVKTGCPVNKMSLES
jgi:hypothetical protein